jgi:hypothetical protein
VLHEDQGVLQDLLDLGVLRLLLAGGVDPLEVVRDEQVARPLYSTCSLQIEEILAGAGAQGVADQVR